MKTPRLSSLALGLALLLLAAAPVHAAKPPSKKSPHTQIVAVCRVETAPAEKTHKNHRKFLEFDVTIVSYSRMLQMSLIAAEKLSQDEGIECEVIDLRTLRPLDLEPAYASVTKTHRCVVVQEQWKPFGAAAEIAASITENVFDDLDAPVARVTGEDVPMPYARNLELLATPHEQHVIAAVKKVMYANG